MKLEIGLEWLLGIKIQRDPFGKISVQDQRKIRLAIDNELDQLGNRHEKISELIKLLSAEAP